MGRSKLQSVKSRVIFSALVTLLGCSMILTSAFGGDLNDVKKRGVLRHLGVPYANFVTGSGDGLDVEMMQLFAKYLGVKYQYVKTSWSTVISDLTGKKVKPKGSDVEILGEAPVRGDVIANGLTHLAWRAKVVNYSDPTFPTQVWLIARADSPIQPIKPSGNIDKDIETVKSLLRGHSLLGKAKTCLDPSIYNLAKWNDKIVLFEGSLNELAPAIISSEAELTLLDVPDALIALEKWPAQIKVIGPLTPKQWMGAGFAKTSSQLLAAFNRFFAQCKKDGTYLRLVKKYYPAVFDYFPEFFQGMK